MGEAGASFGGGSHGRGRPRAGSPRLEALQATFRSILHLHVHFPFLRTVGKSEPSAAPSPLILGPVPLEAVLRAIPPPRAPWLDVFRGLAVVGMILVNNPGDPRFQSPWLAHAAWDGLTLADLVFPFFLVSVGISLTLHLGQGGSKRTLGRLMRRSLRLVALGLLFHLWISRDFSSFRIPGVLQRIGVCSLLGGLLVLRIPQRGIAWIAIGIVGAYSAILVGVHAPSFLSSPPEGGSPPVEVHFEDAPPAFRPGYLSKEGSLPSYIDRGVLGHHLYRPQYDPEGILSTGSAVSTVLLGCLAGLWMTRAGPRRGRHGTLFLWGLVLAAAGLLVSRVLPINKALWSPSFVLVTAGISFAFLSALAFTLELRSRFTWYRPLEIFGANALLVYIGSNLLTLIMDDTMFGHRTLAARVFEGLLLSGFGGAWASFLYGSSHVVVWLPILWILHRKRIHVRV